MVNEDTKQENHADHYEFVCYWNPKASTSPFAFSDENHFGWIPLFRLKEQPCLTATENK